MLDTPCDGCVLIVDDEPVIREFLAMKFAQAGYRVIAAGNGAEAIDLLRTETPDLVISDLNMPFVDGLELCRHLADQQNTSGVPVILLTSQTLERLRDEHPNIASTIAKPFSATQVVTRSVEVIENRRALRAFEQDQLRVI